MDHARAMLEFDNGFKNYAWFRVISDSVAKSAAYHKNHADEMHKSPNNAKPFCLVINVGLSQ